MKLSEKLRSLGIKYANQNEFNELANEVEKLESIADCANDIQSLFIAETLNQHQYIETLEKIKMSRELLTSYFNPVVCSNNTTTSSERKTKMFKVGDHVRCIDNYCASALVVDEIYEVIKQIRLEHYNCIEIAVKPVNKDVHYDLGSAWTWGEDRFVKV